MGQYYHYINLDTKEYLDPFDFSCGIKLMESAYYKNNYQIAMMHLLENEWAGDRVLLCGDYAWDDEKYHKILVDKFGIDSNPYEHCFEEDNELVDDTDSSNIEPYTNISNHFSWSTSYKKSSDINPFSDSIYTDNTPMTYLVNDTKKEYIDLRHGAVAWIYFADMDDSRLLHENITPEDIRIVRYNALPLLIAVGNGLGGGDYYTDDENNDLVGSWVGDSIFTTNNVDDLNGMTDKTDEIIFDEYDIELTASDEDIRRYLLSEEGRAMIVGTSCIDAFSGNKLQQIKEKIMG